MSECKYPKCAKEGTNFGYCRKHRAYSLPARYSILTRESCGHLSISKTEYLELCQAGICFYCGGDTGMTTGHTLDKVDPKKGYKLSNVVSCCRNCNMIKNNLLTLKEMQSIIEVLKHLRNTEETQRPLWAKQGGKRNGF